MPFAKRRNRPTHFSEHIPVVMQSMTAMGIWPCIRHESIRAE